MTIQPTPLTEKIEKIKKMIEDMMSEKNDNPRDSTFRFLQNFHGEAQHISLRYPGKFVKSLPTDVFTINNRNYRMDGAELILPDNEIPNKATINCEHQTTSLTEDKKDVLYDYKLDMISKYKLPCLNIVVTNIGDEDYNEIYESHGDAFKVYVRVFNEKEICQRLNNLETKIENNHKLSEIDVLDFAYILLFVSESKAKRYTSKVVHLFNKVKNMDLNLQLDIHYVLKKLIRLHFRDNKEKTKELLTMITETIHPELLEKLPTLKKALENEATRTKELQNALTRAERSEQEIQKLKQKLKENNIEVD